MISSDRISRGRAHTARTVAGTGIVLILALAGCSNGADDEAAPAEPTAAMSSEMMSAEPSESGGDSMAKDDAMAAVPGSYITYEEYATNPDKYSGGDVVLFFNATWCPTCQEATKNLQSSTVPDGLTIVSVDYDSSTDLKQEYGVTTQHTYVQIDTQGEQVTKFTGATTVQQIQDELA